MATYYYVITYVSYGQYKDHETYAEEEIANKRFEILKNCKYASKLQIKKVLKGA